MEILSFHKRRCHVEPTKRKMLFNAIRFCVEFESSFSGKILSLSKRKISVGVECSIQYLCKMLLFYFFLTSLQCLLGQNVWHPLSGESTKIKTSSPFYKTATVYVKKKNCTQNFIILGPRCSTLSRNLENR